MALHRLIIALDELAVERLPLSAKWRWSRFLRAHARVVRLAQLEWIRGRAGAPTIPLAPGRLPIEQLGPDTIVGVHALEEHLGRLFRWSEPVVQLHLAPFEREHELRIETGGIRGDPLAAVVAVILDRRLLPKKMLSSDGDGTLVLRLPSSRRPAAGSDVIIVCAPLAPARTGSSIGGLALPPSFDYERSGAGPHPSRECRGLIVWWQRAAAQGGDRQHSPTRRRRRAHVDAHADGFAALGIDTWLLVGERSPIIRG